MRKRDRERAYRKHQKFCDAALRAAGVDPERLVINPKEFARSNQHLGRRGLKKALKAILTRWEKITGKPYLNPEGLIR